MKTDDFKQKIKPLIKECLKEILIEEGFMKMLSESKQSVEQETVSLKSGERTVEVQKKQLQETRKQILEKIGKTGFDPFSGTEPLKEDSQIKSADSGVDISKIMSTNKNVWNQMLNGMSKKKDK